MKILLDTANVDIIRKYCEDYPIVGVTTNPSILAKECSDPVDTLIRIKKVIGKERQLHVQLTETTYQEMVEEAYLITNLLGKDTYIKVPVSEVGVKVIKKLSEDGLNVTATAILTATQAMIAAEAGAKYVAPYVSRLENILGDGIETVADIATIFANGKYSTEILGASFKTAKQVLDIALVGAENATISPDIAKLICTHPTSDISIEKFDKDWKESFKMPLSKLIKNKNKE